MRLLFLVLFTLCWSTAGAALPTILVVESYHDSFQWDHDYRQTLSEALNDKYRLEFFQMDTKRLPAEKHPMMAAKALARIAELQPALVVLGDDAALRLVGPDLDKTGIPGVYLGINNNPRNYATMGFQHITGVLERPHFKRGMQFIREIVPKTRKVLVIFDDNFTSDIIQRELFPNGPVIGLAGMEINLKICTTYAEWQQAITNASADGYQIIVSGLHQVLRDNSGKVVDSEQVMRWTSTNTPLPLFAFWDFDVAPDMAIGGLVLSGSEQGRAAAILIHRILDEHVAPATIFPIIASQGSFVFSRRQLSRFGISLPPSIARIARFVD